MVGYFCYALFSESEKDAYTVYTGRAGKEIGECENLRFLYTLFNIISDSEKVMIIE